jgi:hypothetical protein
MGRPAACMRGKESACRILVGTRERRRPLERSNIDGRIVLKRILE